MAEGEYMKFLFAIAERRDLTATAKIVYSRISDRIGNNPHAFPGMRRIAKDCGCGLYAVKTAIRQLEDVGLIAVKRPSGNPARQTNCYSVTPGGCKPTRTNIPVRGANQHVSGSAVDTCRFAPSVRGANQHITRPIEPDQLNQKKTPPTPPRGESSPRRHQPVPRGTSDGDVGETEPIEDIIGPPGCEPHGLPPGRTGSPDTNAAMPKAVLDALIAYIGSPASIGGKLRSNIERYVGQYGEPMVLDVLAEAKARGRRWGDLGFMLNERKQKEYDRGKSTGSNIDAAETRRAAQRAREHPADDRPAPRVDFTTAAPS